MIAIVAMTPSRVIGCGNAVPWRLAEDLRWFKQTTLGHPVLMGRKTFASLKKPLPGRRNLVVSRTAHLDGERVDGIEVIGDLTRFDPEDYHPELFVIGGAEIYRALLPSCRELLVTHVKAEYPGDVFFPPYEDLFRPAEEIRDTPEFRIVRYARVGGRSEAGAC
ncbi:MAG: dihydrofolate reductase [Verrucomicrobia bacterium]|nr:dihydrofolate reductase [Verrucomicrobiota bacterium]